MHVAVAAESAADRKPRYRSGAAARLAGMPVNTLRIWERRYAVVTPPKSPSGQRLYSDHDVQRLACLRTLAEQGHAIGTIAHLPLHELQALTQSWRDGGPGRVSATPALRLALVGAAWRTRLNDGWSLHPFQPVVSVGSLADALLPAEPTVVDALLIQVSSLQEEDVDPVLTLAERLQARSVAVVYAFGTAGAAESLRLAGVRVYREPMGAVELRQILHDLQPSAAHADDAPARQWVRSPARYTDEHLGLMARLSSTVACECPRHLAGIIMQLTAFEEYSDSCASRTAADAALHRHLGDVANRARALFESALDRLALEEGWDIPQGDMPAALNLPEA